MAVCKNEIMTFFRQISNAYKSGSILHRILVDISF